MFASLKSRYARTLPVAVIILSLYFIGVAVSAISTAVIVNKIKRASADAVTKTDAETARLVKEMREHLKDQEEEVLAELEKLISYGGKEKLLVTFQTQVIDWTNMKSAGEETQYAFPLSPKQFAWAIYLLNPGVYQNPKTDPAIYGDDAEVKK